MTIVFLVEIGIKTTHAHWSPRALLPIGRESPEKRCRFRMVNTNILHLYFCLDFFKMEKPSWKRIFMHFLAWHPWAFCQSLAEWYINGSTLGHQLFSQQPLHLFQVENSISAPTFGDIPSHDWFAVGKEALLPTSSHHSYSLLIIRDHLQYIG